MYFDDIIGKCVINNRSHGGKTYGNTLKNQYILELP